MEIIKKKIMNQSGFVSFVVALLVLNIQSFDAKEQQNSEPELKLKQNTRFDANNSIENSRHNAITLAIEKASPAIVGINITEVVRVAYRDPFSNFFDDPFYEFFFGQRQRRGGVREYEVSGLGSGFIISPDGYILTNHHVAGNATKIIVTTTDAEKHNAEIIGTDEVSDVALLKIQGKDFPYLELADSDDILVGEWAIALGNPFGLFDLNAKPTVTVGVVSNHGVNFTQENRVYREMIQTDAAISSGNSGGPLVNALGQVIGINTVIFTTAQTRRGAGSIGIGWAIPINRVKEIVSILMKDKKINRNFFTGMEVREIDQQIARYLNTDITEGVVITTIYRDSPAAESNLEPGDIILKINGMKILRADDYAVVVNDCVVGQKLDITVQRGNNIINTTLTLRERKR